MTSHDSSNSSSLVYWWFPLSVQAFTFIVASSSTLFDRRPSQAAHKEIFGEILLPPCLQAEACLPDVLARSQVELCPVAPRSDWRHLAEDSATKRRRKSARELMRHVGPFVRHCEVRTPTETTIR
eukprot:CAMPEP_0194547906 /NCGR_PEP_ID=MMETSP0253-20130528/92836_1 /TAXON_ID=2966 /ORGANISM="Noctiluca scintillans" /LENGTH=124 /DNA_ID=CAMNT_0039395165 /DNA_START=117 /DNA_END=489 /DNA_ORIENTATION=+